MGGARAIRRSRSMTEFLALSREVVTYAAIIAAALLLGSLAGVLLAATSFAVAGDTEGACWVLHAECGR